MSSNLMREIYLFEDQPAEVKTALLAYARHKLAKAERSKKQREANVALQEAVKGKRYRPRLLGGTDLMVDFYDGGILDLDDGWCRLVCVSRFNTIEVWNGERFETPDLRGLSLHYRGARTRTKWPVFVGGLGKFRVPWAHRAEVVPIEWHEEVRQFKVTFDAGPAEVTYWFRPLYTKSGQGEDWLKPRFVQQSSPIDLKKFKPPKAPKRIGKLEGFSDAIYLAYRAGGPDRAEAMRILVGLNPGLPSRLIKEFMDELTSKK